MKIPAPPPPASLDALLADPPRFTNALEHIDLARDRYLSWDEMSFRKPPVEISREEWWAVTALKRRGAARRLPLRQLNGEPFWFTLPDSALKPLDNLATRAGGAILLDEQVTNPATRDQYLVHSLMEEAITSSQLEGAMTTRRVAKDMLRSGRKPVTHDEQMIHNNYAAMNYVREHHDTRITPALVIELHAILVDGTLDDPSDAGRLQQPGETRIHVATHDDVVLHSPPPADELPSRLQELCAFANGDDEAWLPPIARAIFTHFMMGHDHNFVDGNGRLARTLYYWVMLRQGYWLTEFTTISGILKQAQGQYGRAYLNSEYEGDVTYFLLNQLTTISQAFDNLETYLRREMNQTEEFRAAINSEQLGLNHRQVALLEAALRNPLLDATLLSHSRTHKTSQMTARADLHALEDRGFLVRRVVGRQHHWSPAPNLRATLMRMSAEL